MSMNVFFLFNPASKLSFSKRLQKYNFFLIPQAFLKKNFLKIFADKIQSQSCNEPQFLSVWEGKDNIFSLYKTSLFKTFFYPL